MIEKEVISLGGSGKSTDGDRFPDTLEDLCEDYKSTTSSISPGHKKEIRFFEGESLNPRYYTLAAKLMNLDWWLDLVDLEFPTPEKEYIRRVRHLFGLSELSAWCIVSSGRANGCIPVVEDAQTVNVNEVVPDSGLHPLPAWTTAHSVHWIEEYGICPRFSEMRSPFEIDPKNLVEAVTRGPDSEVKNVELVDFLREKTEKDEEFIEEQVSNAIGQAFVEGEEGLFLSEVAKQPDRRTKGATFPV